METFFCWVINHTNRRYTLIGALSGEQEMNLVNIVRAAQQRGLDVVRSTFNQDIPLNTQLHEPDVTQGYDFVPANMVIESTRLINIIEE